MEHDENPDDLQPAPVDETSDAVTPEPPPTVTPSPLAEDAVTTAHQETGSSHSVLPKVLVVLGAVLLIAILGMQAYIVVSANSTSAQVESLEGAVSDLSGDVARVEGSVEQVGTQVAEFEAAAANSSLAAGTPSAVAVPAGSLPRFEQGQEDSALGVQLGSVAGDEYYTQTALDVDPADGTARLWLIWAHWCPYCQEELPGVSAWWTANADSYENVEVVSVTTSIDPSRGNPLEPYLDDLQLPFPTLVDDDLTMSSQFGVSAFPFWVVTDGDGTVLFRTAGLLPIEQVEAIAGQLEELAA